MYLSYDDYVNFGGNLDESKFLMYEKKAETKLDYYTQNRIKSLDVIIDEVKTCVFEFICYLLDNSTNDSNLTSYSNGVESFSFNTNVDPYAELYRIALEILPINLITSHVD